MDHDSMFNYFYNLINNSLIDVNKKNEINQNLYSILAPFYSNYLNNSKNSVNKNGLKTNHLAHASNALNAPKPLPLKRKRTENDNIGNDLKRKRLIEFLQQNQLQLKEPRFNIGQSIKTRNLNNILDKIHSFKTNDGKADISKTVSHESQKQTNSVQKYPDEMLDSRNSGEVLTNNHNISSDQTNKETPNGKTVRQLLEERQTFIDKLKQNQRDIMKCHIKIFKQGNPATQSQLPTLPNIEVSRSKLPRIQIPEMISICINNNPNERVDKIASSSSSKTNNIEPATNSIVGKSDFKSPGYKNQSNKNHINKNPTVKQLLEQRRKSKQNNHARLLKQGSGHASFDPLPNKRSQILNKEIGVKKQNPFLITLGLNPNNPIVLSDDESIDSSVVSLKPSITTTEKIIESEEGINSSNAYDLFSEHNYVFDANLVSKAKQVINNLNRELKSMNNIRRNDEKQEIIEKFSAEQKKSSFNILKTNHESYDEKSFAKHLNLVKSRDLKRISIAYLNANYPSNEISRAIYAGLETKKAVLDFPRSLSQVNHKNRLIAIKSKLKILDYNRFNNSLNPRQVSSNWSQVLQYLDFSSPLGQKIIKIFPEFHSKRLKRKALKMKQKPN